MARPKKKVTRANGKGSVRELQPGKKYQLRLPASGTHAGATRAFYGTEAQARDELDRWVGERMGVYGSAMTVSELAREYLDVYCTAHQEVSTLTDTTWVVENKIIDNPVIGSVPLDRLTTADVQRWMLSLVKKKKLTRNTLRAYRRPLHAMIEWAVERSDCPISTNPVTNAKLPADRHLAAQRDIGFLSLDEARRFIDACQDPEDWGPYFVTIAMLGLRPGEADGLHWSDIDFDASTVTIRHAMKRRKGAPDYVGPTKTGDERTIELPDVVADALKRQRDILATFDVQPAPEWSDLVFVRTGGQPVHGSTIRQQLDRVCNVAKVKRLTPYALRHSCASILIDQGIPEAQVARMLGTSEAMLRQTYRHWLDDVARGHQSVWDGVLSHDVATTE